MKTNYLILFFLVIHLFFNGCDNSTEPINKDGRISGKITIGEYNRNAKKVLVIKLHKDNGNNIQFIDSTFTKNARYIFEDLEDGLYLVSFTQDNNYTPFRNWQPGDGISQSFEVKSSSKTDSLDFHLFAWHHFTQDSILIEVDTTNWISKSVSSKFYNDGVRDTIVWHFNPNRLPDWLEITPTSGSYEPEAQSDKWLSITINKHSFPNNYWNSFVQLEIFSQFAIHVINVWFKVV
jgi:hypothetical protein